MYEALLTVKFLTSKNSFCILSLNNYKHLQNGYIKLLFNDKEIIYVSVAPAPGSFDDQSIGVNSLYAKALGIEENSLVAVSEIAKPPTIKTVVISALEENDHYVLEALAESVQSTLLEQIRVLSNGQIFIIWIGKTIHVKVSVSNIQPISPGVIDNLTEVVIKPPEKEFKHVQNCQQEKFVKNTTTFDFLAEYTNKTQNLILRVVPTSSIIDKINNSVMNNDFNVFISKNANPSLTTPSIQQMTLLTVEEEKSVYVRLFFLEDFIHNFTKANDINEQSVFISDSLIKHFNSDIGARVLLEAYDGPIPDIREIEICTKTNYVLDTTKTFQQYLADNCKEEPFVLCPNVVIDVCDNLQCFVRFQPPQAPFTLINPDFVRDCKLIFVKENLPENKNVKSAEFSLGQYTTEVANYRDIIDRSTFLLTHKLQAFAKLDNIIITGKTGSGKTTLSKIIANKINEFPHFIFTKMIRCKAVKGKTIESLHKLFSTTFYELIHHQPSVLIVDDIHVLCEKIQEGDLLVQQALYFNRVSEMLNGLFHQFCEFNAVGILATTESTSKLNKNIYTTRGNHLFKNVMEVDSLTRRDRIKLLQFFFLNFEVDADLDRCREKTESFVIQDMVDFANKTLFEVCQEDENSERISQIHIDSALRTVTETCLSNINLLPPGEKNLSDIGGLKDAKEILIETLLWPSKYPDLFTNAPLRLASGLLLYGPPGTGKTLLAGAAAKHCGLRLISIKGPELLSKYIGASEQAVRDVFQRAQSARPCILFFDEFDSLAPRRGHDNTGVTDRVVNQLLTHLDGIESLSGVFVLAATSRPDLLDPALLRPGRLDIHIRCSLPDEPSRLEILKALSKSLNFSPEVNLDEIAGASDGFSGADLQAVLYSAQLDSVKGFLEDDVEIRQTQLVNALRNTRPSLTKIERLKYERIYQSFEGGSSSDFTPGSKATLA